jgi:hypothetical protein
MPGAWVVAVLREMAEIKPVWRGTRATSLARCAIATAFLNAPSYFTAWVRDGLFGGRRRTTVD